MSPKSSSIWLVFVSLILTGSLGVDLTLKRADQLQIGNPIEDGGNRQLGGDLPPEHWLQHGFNSSLKSIRLRRQSEGSLGSIGVMFGLSCPERLPERTETPTMSAEILLHRTSHGDDISIAGSNSDAKFELAIDRLLDSAGFQRDKPTLIYMAGWMQTAQSNWLRQARKALDDLVSIGGGMPTAAPVNLMIFDYAAYNSLSFARSVSMVPYVGQVLANFLQQLIDKQAYSANKIHIVSYSLSTHIAGIAGRLLQSSGRGQLAQITAIDPTGVCFHQAENEPFDSEFGLRASDAKLVLARHYNMKGLGAGRPIGGVDVFVNGGERQPRMSIQDWNPIDMFGSTGVLWAGHRRAVQHEVASSGAYRLGDCHEIAYKCPSFVLFKRGQCANCGKRNESCLLISTLGSHTLGIEPQNVNYANNTRMYLMTGIKRFCTYNYQVVARLKRRPPVSVLSTFERGQAKFELMAGVSVAPMHRLNADTAAGYSDSSSSISFTSLLRLGANSLKLPDRISCSSGELFDSIETLEVNFMSSTSPAVRRNKSAQYCPGERDKLKLIDCR